MVQKVLYSGLTTQRNPDLSEATPPPSPQERWQAFRTQLPVLTRRQKWFAIGSVVVVLSLLILIPLPFLLPLAGPKPQDPQTLADANGHFITLDGETLYYQHAAGNGEAVILIHGQAGSTLTWRETMPALQAAGFDVYAVDLIGLGLSDKGLAFDHSHPAQANRVLALMDQLGIEQAYLVAHAFNSNVAMHIAQIEPERVVTMAFAAPTLFTEPSPEIPEWVFDVGFLQRWARVGMHFIVHEAVEEQLRSATKFDEVVTGDLVTDYSRVLSTKDWDLSVLAMLRDSHKNALRQPLQSVEIPVLLLWGTEDGWATPDHADGLLEKLPQSCLVMFDGVGHLPMHEVPAQFSESLMEFFERPCKNSL